MSSSLVAEHTSQRIAICRHDQQTPLVVQQALSAHRPFLHPISAPDGDGTITEDAPPHHRWQHGVYVGLNDVSGIGFWTEGLTASATDGTFHPRPLAAPVVTGDRASWTVVSDWRFPDGRDLLTETQHWTLLDRGSSYELDLEWTLRARVDLQFGHSAYGGLFVRMPFRGVGTALNSAGQVGSAQAEGQRARWVAIAMPLPDRRSSDAVAGLAILDHPGNAGHPTPWRVDGQLGVGPSPCIAGPRALSAGHDSTARYRLIVHAGATSVPLIEAAWARYAT